MAELVVRGIDHRDAATDDIVYRRGDVIDIMPDGHVYGSGEVVAFASGVFLLIEAVGSVQAYRHMTDTEEDDDGRMINRRGQTLDFSLLSSRLQAEIADHSSRTVVTPGDFASMKAVRVRRG